MSHNESELAAALAYYRREMTAANRAWFQGKIDALYSHTHLTDKQRMKALAPYFRYNSWPKGDAIREPQQLLIPPDQPGYVEAGINSDGTIPPTTMDEQVEYLTQLNNLLQETANDAFEPPTEFAEFISMVGAAAEPDFRNSQCPGLGGTSWELDRESMHDMQPEVGEWYRDGWHVVAGWQCASEPLGVTLILYAHKHLDDEQNEENKLKWRVYTSDNNDEMYAGGKWFSSIADYLRDRCQWFHRLPEGWQDQWMRPMQLAPDDAWVA